MRQAMLASGARKNAGCSWVEAWKHLVCIRSNDYARQYDATVQAVHLYCRGVREESSTSLILPLYCCYSEDNHGAVWLESLLDRLK
jgi:hypothetical protein